MFQKFYSSQKIIISNYLKRDSIKNIYKISKFTIIHLTTNISSNIIISHFKYY